MVTSIYTQSGYSCLEYHTNNMLLPLPGNSVATNLSNLMLRFSCINLILHF